MARPSDEEQLRRFVETLRALGGSAGNIRLQHELGLNEDEYWRLREKLLEAGSLVRGRGRGGSVMLIEPTSPSPNGGDSPIILPPTAPAPPAPGPASYKESESTLYPPCLSTLREHWAKERGLQDVHLEVCAHQGSRRTGGPWTRPDILAISMRTFRHWPGRYFDLWTFEIKPKRDFSVIGVFEAAAHARASTQSYAMFHVDSIESPPEQSRRIESEAQRLGVGLIIFEDPAVFDKWDIVVEPLRREPDPALLEEMLAVQLTDLAKDLLIRWGK